jgi:uncharacterized membrane protein YphA (DoxX/SURF4 family)
VPRESPKRATARYPSIGYASIRRKSILLLVQRLFSMFPSGWPGIALLLLRASVATAVLLEGYSHLHGLSGWTFGALLVLLSICLCVGFLTPIVAILALLFHMLAWSSLSIDGAGMIVITLLNALALAMLGPGAYSIDAYRFGRRVVVLPPS